MMERINGTDKRDLSNAVYLGRYTCVWMSTKSFAGRDMTEQKDKEEKISA